MPHLLFQIALIVIAVREIYAVVRHLQTHRDWLEILYHIAFAVVALYFLLG